MSEEIKPKVTIYVCGECRGYVFFYSKGNFDLHRLLAHPDSNWQTQIKRLEKGTKEAKTVTNKRMLSTAREKLVMENHTEIIREQLEKKREKALRDPRLEGLGGYITIEARK